VGAVERVDIAMAFKAWPRSWQMDAVSWLDGRTEGGFTREVASHFLFLSRRMFGPLRALSSSCRYADAGRSERSLRAQVMAGPVPVSITGDVGITEQDDHNTWTLTGAQGRVRLRDWSIAEREVDGVWQTAPDAVANEVARARALGRQLDKIAAMTRGEATNLATLDEAFDVQTIVEQILKS
jgi:predicted dehydrogenase